MFKIDDVVRVGEEAKKGIYKLRYGCKGTVIEVDDTGCWVSLPTGRLYFFNEELEHAE